ncbi:MAG: DUF1045 domain-containing protein [Hyphomicrobiales bacterium]|nr:DUF1045 domain-containing protein [Hyphomicrobiales bacterium]
MNGVRHAIYFAPAPHDPLAGFGAAALGYDAEAGKSLPQPKLDGVHAADWRDWTAEPRRYGFHATLKAPFRLREPETEAALFSALQEFAARRASIGFDLKLASIGRFIALVPTQPDDALSALERDLVGTFERFRAPLSEAEIARRLAAPLTQRQLASLGRFGYPYVLDDFRFHMTLSGPLEGDQRATAMQALRTLLIQATARPRAEIDSLAIFRQDSPGSNFRIVFRAPLRCAQKKEDVTQGS